MTKQTGRAIGLSMLMILASAADSRSQPGADAQGPPGDPAQRKFVRDYMAAVSAGDVTALRRLVHAKTLACINDTNRDFFDFVLARAVKERPTSSYRVTRIGPLGNAAPLLWPPDTFRYPVRPTHEVQIDFETGVARSKTLIRQIALSRGSWFEVMPCPTSEGLQLFRNQQREAQQQRARAEELAVAIGEPLLSELRELLAEHRRLQAIKKYQDQSGADVTTAVQVIDVLERP